ncbi:hypothetical protein DKT77_16930 [Meridianimarinicoccus roseus]|uniref:Transposase n=1 Tax=Meridianimarinicoccus roseus TaxID=2072018 RepID=A0A2V2LHU3_9RHOB|nr:hypothetical protein DKT77_16930 [Meridianimarinicoccus roseus]
MKAQAVSETLEPGATVSGVAARYEIMPSQPTAWRRLAKEGTRDLAAMSDLPASPFDACDQATGRVNSQALVRYKTNDYVQVLRLLETFDIDDLHAAVKKALQLGAVGFDAVKHLALCHVEKRPPKLDLDIYPYLPRANVGTTSAASYMSLLSGDAA